MPEEFGRAARAYGFDAVRLDPAVLRPRARRWRGRGSWSSESRTAFARRLAALSSALDARAGAFEWSYEEMHEPVQRLVRTGELDFDVLWSLPPTAEYFVATAGLPRGTSRCSGGSARSAGSSGRSSSTVSIRRRRARSGATGSATGGQAARRAGSAKCRLLVLTGASHARLDAPEGATMAAHLARRLPGLRPAMLDYARGRCWSRGRLHDVGGPVPASPITFRLPEATPAVVPAHGNKGSRAATP